MAVQETIELWTKMCVADSERMKVNFHVLFPAMSDCVDWHGFERLI
jgi:hypothetical protein